MVTTVTRSGQLKLSAEIRKRLGIKPGDRVEVFLRNGTIEVIPYRSGSIRDLKGLLPKPKRALTIKEMNDAIAQAACERAMR